MSGKRKVLVRVADGVSGTVQVESSNTFIELTAELQLPADHPCVTAHPALFTEED